MLKKTRERLIYGGISLIAICIITVTVVIFLQNIRKEVHSEEMAVITEDTHNQNKENVILIEPDEISENITDDVLPGISNKDYEVFEEAINRLSSQMEGEKK